MHPRIKICCIASLAEARLAIGLGADALGLVSAMPSGPGVIEEATIAGIAAAVPPPIATFLLTCLTTADAIVRQQERCATSTIQLVDALEAGELALLRRALPAVRLVQVLHVRDEAVLDEARAAAPHVHAVLLDSGNPALAVKQLGGTGRTHDWALSARVRDLLQDRAVPLYLAGGLHAGNVAEAVRTVRPFAVDVCSGVRTDGALDATKAAAFIAAVRDATLPG